MKLKSLLYFFFLPVFSFSQINVGNDQIVCLGDTTSVFATLAWGNQGSGSDTVFCGTHSTNFTSTLTRGFHFQAQSSFTVSGLMCATENSGSGYNQSVQFVVFGDSVGGVWNALPPTNVSVNGTNFVTLFSSIDDSTSGFIACNISVDSGQYYGIIGSRHIATAGTTGQMYNSYTTTTGATVDIDGYSTLLSRLYYQSSLSGGVAPSGTFAAQTGGGQVGRVHMKIGAGVSWYDVNTGTKIGDGDTLEYSPSQSTSVAGVVTDSVGQSYADTMNITVLNTTISSTGQSLCNGPVTLSVPSGFSSYNWNVLGNSSSLIVSNSGTYYVTCISATGQICQSAPYTVYSGNIPISLSTPDSVFICQGDIVTIDGPPGYSQYNWSNGSSIPSITVSNTGTYSLIVTDANGCLGVSGTTTIEIFPQSISLNVIGGFSLCNGNTPILDAGPGFASYLWSAPGALNNSTSQSLTVNIAGDYFVNVTYPSANAGGVGCSAISDTVTIYSAQQQFFFTIGTIGEDSLCMPNGQLILDAGNYTAFSWNTGANTRQISTNSLGATYFVNVTDSNGCQGVSNPAFTVYNIVNTSSISGSLNPNQGQSNTYTVASSSGSTYHWMSSGIIQSGAGTNTVDIVFNSVGNHDIFVLETDVNGCIGDTIYLTVNVFPGTAIEENNMVRVLDKIINVLGEETIPQNNIPLFYLYKDGTVEKRVVIE